MLVALGCCVHSDSKTSHVQAVDQCSRFTCVSTDLVNWIDCQLEESGLDDDAGLVNLAAPESDGALDERPSSLRCALGRFRARVGGLP